ncbi:Gfo/Idh/MocA family oxidoreductase [Mucilaginibacter koreensis]
MATINWGIIGCGDVTEKKSGPAFNKVPNSRLKAVMRRDAAKAEDYAQRHGVGEWYADANEMMAQAGIEAVYIATPPANHMPYAIDALQRGLHVYVEKPVTLNADEARQIAEAAKSSSTKLSVAHYRRALPMFLLVKKLLDEQVIGDVRTVQIRMWQSPKPALVADVATNWRVQPELSGGGYFHDLAPHQLDLMLFYFGKPKAYQGFSLNQSGLYPADDQVCGHILFENQVTVNGSWCFNVAESDVIDECVVVGSKGSITFPFFGNQVSWKAGTENHSTTFEHPQHIEQPMIQQVVAWFNGEQENPCSIEEAITLMEIMDAFTGKN